MDEPIKYQEVIDLGFETEHCHDNVWFSQYGYDYKIVSYNLTKRLTIFWEMDTRTCNVKRCDKEHNVKAERKLTLEQVKDLIEFFKD